MGNNNSRIKNRILNSDISNDITESCVLDKDCNIINETENEVSIQCNLEDIYYMKKIKKLEDTIYTLENENDTLFSDLQRYKIKIKGLLESFKPKQRRSNPFNCEDYTNTSNQPSINPPSITIEDEY